MQDTQQQAVEQMDTHIFRAYDIRGVVETALTPSTVTLIGKALGTEAQAKGETTFVVGRDGRLSGPDLVEALKTGLLSTGINVIDLGMVTTPMVYFAANTLDQTSSCAMVTGSHNPPNYNGIKMMIAGVTLSGDDIQGLLRRVQAQDFVQGQGQQSHLDIFPAYQASIEQTIQLARPLKVVVDAGNGIAGASAPSILRALGCDVVELFCDVDGTFPNHHPDPAKPQNVQDLIAAVKSHQADIGLAFDGDGDRVGVVDELGNTTFADQQMMIFAKELLMRKPGASIIFDVKCSSILANVIEQSGGTPRMWRTGHSFIKAKLKAESQAQLAGEMSGHIFFKDRWYGFDDGTYTACRMLEILASQERPLSDLFDELPKTHATPELELGFAEGENHAFIQTFAQQARFDGGEVFAMDGIRVDWPDGWGLVRASNTTPILVMRFDGSTPEALERIKNDFRQQLLAQDPTLDLPF